MLFHDEMPEFLLTIAITRAHAVFTNATITGAEIAPHQTDRTALHILRVYIGPMRLSRVTPPPAREDARQRFDAVGAIALHGDACAAARNGRRATDRGARLALPRHVRFSCRRFQCYTPVMYSTRTRD